jgi:hypothetical protein
MQGRTPTRIYLDNKSLARHSITLPLRSTLSSLCARQVRHHETWSVCKFGRVPRPLLLVLSVSP